MNILIIGCGRVGSTLAMAMAEKGHDVAVLDKKQSAFEQLDDNFSGLTFEGVPIDTDSLQKAGIRSCDVVCAVTEDDNQNIMASELAKELFNVPTVLTRILSPEKEDVFREFGIKSVCSTRLTVDAIVSSLDEYDDEQYLRYGNHTVKFFNIEAPKSVWGKKAHDIDYEQDEILYAVIKANGTFKLIDNYNTTIEEGDTLIFSKLVD